MEINPIFWGSLNLAIQSGVDFPYLFYQMARTGDCEIIQNYRVGVKIKNFDCEFSHLRSFFTYKSFLPQKGDNLLKSLLSIFISQFMVRDDYIALDDINPFLLELLDVGRQAIQDC